MGLQWLIIFTALIIGLLGFVYSRWALSSVTYSRHFDQRTAFEGDEVQMIETIANRKLLPLPWLRLESMIHIGLQFESQANLNISGGQFWQNHKSMFSLLPFTQIVRRHRIRCARRGVYRLDSATMTAGDPFGFGQKVKRFPLSLELTVYPGQVELADIPLPSHSWLGDITVRRWVVEDPFVIAGVREYQPGDPLNAVNWKASARTGNLQIHKRDYTADHRLLIGLNFEVDEQMWSTVTDPDLIEEGIRYAATIAAYAISQGIDTGLICNGQLLEAPKQPVSVESAGGSAQLTALYETMARLELSVSVSFASLLEEQYKSGIQHADILLITPFVSDQIQHWIDRLRAAGNGVEVLQLEKPHQRTHHGNGQEARYA